MEFQVGKLYRKRTKFSRYMEEDPDEQPIMVITDVKRNRLQENTLIEYHLLDEPDNLHVAYENDQVDRWQMIEK